MQIVVRSAVMFVFLWIVMRAMGRKELAELSSFELILVIVMGDLIQQGVTEQDNSLTGAITAISTFALCMLAFSYASFKSKRARAVLAGRPVVIVRSGSPLLDMLRIERLTVDEVENAAREQGIASLSEVSLALLEEDGKFSFLRYDRARDPAPPETQF